MAGNNSEGLRYGTIETKEKYYLEWKNDQINTKAQPLDDNSIDILENASNYLKSLIGSFTVCFKSVVFFGFDP